MQSYHQRGNPQPTFRPAPSSRPAVAVTVEPTADPKTGRAGLCGVCKKCGALEVVAGRGDQERRRLLMLLRENCPAGGCNNEGG